jgi:hypothetical protein
MEDPVRSAPVSATIAPMAKRRALSAMPEGAREFFRQHGAKGGAIGGKRRFAAMTSEERHELAKKAARARWAKQKKRST